MLTAVYGDARRRTVMSSLAIERQQNVKMTRVAKALCGIWPRLSTARVITCIPAILLAVPESDECHNRPR